MATSRLEGLGSGYGLCEYAIDQLVFKVTVYHGQLNFLCKIYCHESKSGHIAAI